ncbi:uncharacterized protein N7477_006957 [Penicillium maclennaniae]|uniref:uncharacterized protein n=1 Tax=Penicillium maclennaniae TaxID=1343394 RepID=UPI002541F7EE|nr:uncharacterized protein N7477_006957 [Penicillium maclennaniae]KAJ5668387.1 hypothetical protein N7477_006957 [Penicillium maclennaniae]
MQSAGRLNGLERQYLIPRHEALLQKGNDPSEDTPVVLGDAADSDRRAKAKSYEQLLVCIPGGKNSIKDRVHSHQPLQSTVQYIGAQKKEVLE